MERKFWAKRKTKIVGPFPTREDALAAFYASNPFKGADYMAKAKDAQIMTGYGEFGPSFDIRWDYAKAIAS